METSPEQKVLHEECDRCVREVRDPATKNGEGIRQVMVDGARAEYGIASRPDGRWAMCCSLSYSFGDMHGSAMPWKAFETREQCVQIFTKKAQRHFNTELHSSGASSKQLKARIAMLQNLNGGLFGFIEPDVP